MLFSTIPAIAQAPLFDYSVTPGDLSVTAQAKYEAYQASRYYDLQLVRINDLGPSIADTILHVNISQPGCPATFLLEQANHDESGYRWFGNLESDGSEGCEDGEFWISDRNNRKFGRIELGDHAYEFMPLGGGINILYQDSIADDYNKICGAGDSLSPPTTHNSNRVTQRSANPDPPCIGKSLVSVLILYTDLARRSDPDVEIRAEMAFEQMQQAKDNSRIEYDNLAFRLAGIELTDFVEGNEARADLIRMNDGRFDMVRNQAEADLIFVITGNTHGETLGSAYNIQPENPVCFGEVEQLTGLRILAHEVGHQLDARHQNDPIGTIEHGYVWRTGYPLGLGKRRFTVVTDVRFGKDGDNNRKRGRRMVTYYSNPDIRLRNEYIGTVSSNDNAERFRQTGNTVANYIPNQGQFGAQGGIEGTETPCACVLNLYRAALSCIDEGDPITWAVSTNGIDFTTVGSGEYLDYRMPCNRTAPVVLRITVVSNGETFIFTKTVFPTLDRRTCREKSARKEVQYGRAVLLPNPVTGGAEIMVRSAAGRRMTGVNVLDARGGEIGQWQPDGTYTDHAKISLRRTFRGMGYAVVKYADGSVQTLKFIAQ